MDHFQCLLPECFDFPILDDINRLLSKLTIRSTGVSFKGSWYDYFLFLISSWGLLGSIRMHTLLIWSLIFWESDDPFISVCIEFIWVILSILVTACIYLSIKLNFYSFSFSVKFILFYIFECSTFTSYNKYAILSINKMYI